MIATARGRGDHIGRPLAQSQGGPIGVALRLVAGFKTMAVVDVRTDKLGGRAVKIDVVLKSREPVGEAVGMVGAGCAVEGQAAAATRAGTSWDRAVR